jgi:hypothetical protein
MKFKVGQKVQVRTLHDLLHDSLIKRTPRMDLVCKLDDIRLNENMQTYCGETIKIEMVLNDKTFQSNGYFWTSWMIENPMIKMLKEMLK